jgi:creatinine amidohydrolase
MTKDDLGHLTWEEVRALDRPRTIVILPIGAIEAHGPHLPLETDGIIATAMARAGAEKLAARGHPAVVLPCLPYTTATFAAAFPGTISITQATATVLITDIANNLTAHGFAMLAIANAHLDPGHLDALDAAVIMARSVKLLPIVFPNLTRKPWGSRLGDEFKSGACHAGQFESSIVLAERPDLVRDALRVELAPNPRSLATAIREGKETFAAAGGSRAYFGNPQAATADEGRRSVDVLGGILEDAVLAELHP